MRNATGVSTCEPIQIGASVRALLVSVLVLLLVALRAGLVPTGIERLGSLPSTDFAPPPMVRWALPTMQPATGPGRPLAQGLRSAWLPLRPNFSVKRPLSKK